MNNYNNYADTPTQLDAVGTGNDTQDLANKPFVVVEQVSEDAEMLAAENAALQREIVKLEQKLHSVTAQLVHVNKLALLGNIGAGIAHELNNPLTVISAEADEIRDTLEEATIDRAELLRSADNIKKCTHRMRAIIDHIREYSRNEQNPCWEKLQINDPIRDSLILLKSQLENAGIAVHVNLDDTLPTIWGNYVKLESVFQNLITNARDAFETNKPSGEKHLYISTSLGGPNTLTITIEDTAGGMTEDVKKNIFNAFFTTKAKGKGTGLGLSIVSTTIKDHMGSIDVETCVGKGTTFVVTLPIDRRELMDSNRDVDHGRQKNTHH